MSINGSSDSEKQVSIDPKSMRERSSTPIKALPSFPTTYKFLSSTSLPNSPRIGARNQTPDHHNPNSIPRSPLTCLSNTRLQRSKSGGEQTPSAPPYTGSDPWVDVNEQHMSSTKNRHGKDGGRTMVKKVKSPNDVDFKCGALCLFLPGFGKGKPVRARRVEPQGSKQIISQRISLEKFECGSWRSSAIHSDDDHNSSTLYFDLPLELIRTSVSDNALPMNSAFVFNKGGVKGVLKTREGSVERKSHEGRHVRFSASSSPKTEPTSPSCITPRLRKAREDFNAFLEAQSA
ncbi:hypothetical protein LXL04_014310 [Taraxacum kok-saghyz]